MKLYSPSDIADLLEVKESTLRKYSLLLEKSGYQFQRNNQNQRWYKDEDITALRKLVSLKNNGDMSLEECAEAVFLWSKGGDITQPLTVIDSDTQRDNDDITELKKLVNNQTEMIKSLISRIDQQQKYIDERLEQRDRMLMESLRESQEERKALLQIAAAQEEEKKKSRKGILKWFRKEDK